MKLVIVAALVGLASAGRLDSNYLPPSSAAQINNAFAPQRVPQGHSGNPGQGGRSGPTPPPPAIVRLSNENPGDGSYRFDFETENKISQQETGQVRNAGTQDEINVIQGSYSYTGPDGVVYTVNYVADENGFRATGDHIPTAGPIPQDILEAVQQNQADEARGIVDDGQYRPEQDERNQNQPQRPNNRPGYRY